MKPRSVPHGVGTIEPRRGKFRVRVLVQGAYQDLDTVDTREKAESLLRGYSAIAAAGEIVTSGETLRSYGAKWLDEREMAKVRNIKTDRSRWGLHIVNAPFIDSFLSTIGRREIKRWIASLSNKKAADRRGARALAPQTVKHVLTLLRSCLQSALDDELIAANPASKIKGPKVSRDDGWTYLMPEEQTRLLTCATIPEPERMIIAFAIGTALRQGEQWNLELPDFIVDGPHPRIVVRYGKPGHQPTKTGKIRVVPLFGIALAAARRWKQLLPIYYPTNPFNLAFPTSRGCRRADTKAPRHWYRYLEDAGLADPTQRHDRREVRWHDLRHTGASSLVAGWWGRVWRLEEVRDLCGHTSITVTERYAHLAPGVLHEAGLATLAELPRAPAALPQILPQISPTAGRLLSQNASDQGRATEDSNLWPSAPEADDQLNTFAGIALRGGDLGEILRPLATRYLTALASRNRFAHKYGVALADAVLALTAAEVAPEVAAPALVPGRPGLARAQATPERRAAAEADRPRAAGVKGGRS